MKLELTMNGIMGFTSLLKEPNILDEEKNHYIDVIERSGFRLLNIINDLIDISKIESGLMSIQQYEVDLNKQLKYLFDFFSTEAETKGLVLQLNEFPSEYYYFNR